MSRMRTRQRGERGLNAHNSESLVVMLCWMGKVDDYVARGSDNFTVSYGVFRRSVVWHMLDRERKYQVEGICRCFRDIHNEP